MESISSGYQFESRISNATELFSIDQNAQKTAPILRGIEPINGLLTETSIIGANGADVEFRELQLAPGLFHLRDSRHKLRLALGLPTFAELPNSAGRSRRIVVGRYVDLDARRIRDLLANHSAGP